MAVGKRTLYWIRVKLLMALVLFVAFSGMLIVAWSNGRNDLGGFALLAGLWGIVLTLSYVKYRILKKQS